MLEKVVACNFKVSNNEAEYEALVIGLQLVRLCGASVLKVYSDSQLVISQVKGEFKVKELGMRAYCTIIQRLASDF